MPRSGCLVAAAAAIRRACSSSSDICSCSSGRGATSCGCPSPLGCWILIAAGSATGASAWDCGVMSRLTSSSTTSSRLICSCGLPLASLGREMKLIGLSTGDCSTLSLGIATTSSGTGGCGTGGSATVGAEAGTTDTGTGATLTGSLVFPSCKSLTMPLWSA